MKNALIIGAGLASEKILDEMLKTKELNIKGILDKDPNKFGIEKKGILILGNYNNIEKYVENLNIEVIIIATTEMSTEEIKEKIQKKIDNKKTVTYILPNIEDLDINKGKIYEISVKVTVNSFGNTNFTIIDADEIYDIYIKKLYIKLDSLDYDTKKKLGEFSEKYNGENQVILYISSNHKTLKLENKFDLRNENLLVELEDNFGKDCFYIS